MRPEQFIGQPPDLLAGKMSAQRIQTQRLNGQGAVAVPTGVHDHSKRLRVRLHETSDGLRQFTKGQRARRPRRQPRRLVTVHRIKTVKALWKSTPRRGFSSDQAVCWRVFFRLTMPKPLSFAAFWAGNSYRYTGTLLSQTGKKKTANGYCFAGATRL